MKNQLYRIADKLIENVLANCHSVPVVPCSMIVKLKISSIASFTKFTHYTVISQQPLTKLCYVTV